MADSVFLQNQHEGAEDQQETDRERGGAGGLHAVALEANTVVAAATLYGE